MGDKKPISWKLRMHNIYQNRKDKNGKAIGLRQVVYVMGGHSIWKEDYPKEIAPKIKPLWFEEGKLMVMSHDKLLITYLENHPDYNKHFKLDDPEADAIKELEALEKLDEVKGYLAKLEDYSALAQALSTPTESIMHETFSQKKLRCYKAAQKNPNEVLKALQDPKTETTYYVMLAFSNNILSVNPAKTDILWVESREGIMSVPTGKKHVQAVVDYIVDDKGDDLLLEINKRIKKMGKPGVKRNIKHKPIATV
jgi:hypothetical protein